MKLDAIIFGRAGRLAAVATHAVVMLLVLIAGPSVASAQEVRLAVSKGPVSLPIYVAESKGYFEREGVAVRLRECLSGRQCFQLLAQDEADVATAAELVMTLSSLAGSDAAIIATISSSVHHIKLVARGTIKAPADLRGKRIATVQGTSAQYFLDSWLIFHDIDPKAVNIVPLAPDRLVGALMQSEVDAIAIWEPIASTALASLGAEARTLPGARVYTQHFSLTASRPAITRREVNLIRLLRALSNAERFIAERPEEARSILRARVQGSPGLDNMAEHRFALTLEQSLIGTMDGQARWAMRQGLVPATPGAGNLLRSIEPALLRAAVPGAVSLVR